MYSFLEGAFLGNPKAGFEVDNVIASDLEAGTSRLLGFTKYCRIYLILVVTAGL